MKKYVVSGIVSTGGKEEDFAFMNLSDLQQIVGKLAQVSVTQFSVVAEGDSLSGRRRNSATTGSANHKLRIQRAEQTSSAVAHRYGGRDGAAQGNRFEESIGRGELDTSAHRNCL